MLRHPFSPLTDLTCFVCLSQLLGWQALALAYVVRTGLRNLETTRDLISTEAFNTRALEFSNEIAYIMKIFCTSSSLVHGVHETSQVVRVGFLLISCTKLLNTDRKSVV